MKQVYGEAVPLLPEGTLIMRWDAMDGRYKFEGIVNKFTRSSFTDSADYREYTILELSQFPTKHFISDKYYAAKMEDSKYVFGGDIEHRVNYSIMLGSRLQGVDIDPSIEIYEVIDSDA